MIRVELIEEFRRRGTWRWEAQGGSLSGFSHQPLLDACRAIKRTSGDCAGLVAGLYRPGRDKPDLWCNVEIGAGLMVRESDPPPRFVKWTAPPLGRLRQIKRKGRKS